MLIQIGINGKLMQVVKNMYQNIMSCVKANGKQSQIFSSEIGVRQDENLSSILFWLFLNDVERFLEINDNNGITIAYKDQDITFFIQILTLLYADDTVIIA